MKLPSITIALVLSAAAGAAVTAAAMPPAEMPKEGTAVQAASRKPVDCHRDVRTHRIGGVMIRHRHVGDNCAVREVKQMTSS